jgi:hypothetical protein
MPDGILANDNVHLVEKNLHLAVRLLTAYQENCHEFTTAEVVNIAANRA